MNNTFFIMIKFLSMPTYAMICGIFIEKSLYIVIRFLAYLGISLSSKVVKKVVKSLKIGILLLAKIKQILRLSQNVVLSLIFSFLLLHPVTLGECRC